MLDTVLPLTFHEAKGVSFLKEKRSLKAPQPRLSQLTTGKMVTKVFQWQASAQQPRTSPEVQFCPVIHEVGHFMSQAHKRVDH